MSVRAGYTRILVTTDTMLKLQDWDAYSRHLTQWERDATLDC
jgi:glutamate---methylamine ligase